MSQGKQIQVMVIDDSAATRVMLRQLAEADPAIAVTRSLASAEAAVDSMRGSLPDVIILDLELPGINGLQFLKMVMTQNPIPIIVCSGLTARGSDAALTCLSMGAVEVILKPTISNAQQKLEAQQMICDAIHAAYQSAKGRPGGGKLPALQPVDEKLSPDVLLPKPRLSPVPKTEPIVVIGASTGGTVALEKLLKDLPEDCPPIAIVQHMPEGFTAAFASRLNKFMPMEVYEAQEGMQMKRGQVILARGNMHLVLRRMPDNYRVSLLDGPRITRHRPSVDILFRSAAHSAGANALGILMTGMGDDGALCLGEMKAAGALTVAQDEASSVVFGMPAEAIRRGHADRIVSLDQMAKQIVAFDRMNRTAVRA